MRPVSALIQAPDVNKKITAAIVFAVFFFVTFAFAIIVSPLKKVTMTTEEVVKLNRAIVDTWNQHDAEKFLSLCNENVIWKDSGVPQPYTGKEGARSFFEMWMTAFPDFSIDIVSTIANDNSIAMEIEFNGTNTGSMKMGDAPEIPATNRKVTANKGTCFAWFENDKLKEVHSYPDTAGMMAQLGLLQEEMV
jgi:steroid delta-isomerase-like uncharacterized protein